MNENWYALFIATQLPVTVDQAFMALDGKKKLKRRQPIRLNAADLSEMQNLRKEGKTYQSIGNMYGISGEAARVRLKKFERAVKR